MNHSKFFVKPNQRNGPGRSKLYPHYDAIQRWLEEDLTLEEIVAKLPFHCSTGNLSRWIERQNNPKTRVKPRLPKRTFLRHPSEVAAKNRPTVPSKPTSIRPRSAPSTTDAETFSYKAGTPLTKREINKNETHE